MQLNLYRNLWLISMLQSIPYYTLSLICTTWIMFWGESKRPTKRKKALETGGLTYIISRSLRYLTNIERISSGWKRISARRRMWLPPVCCRRLVQHTQEIHVHTHHKEARQEIWTKYVCKWIFVLICNQQQHLNLYSFSSMSFIILGQTNHRCIAKM